MTKRAPLDRDALVAAVLDATLSAEERRNAFDRVTRLGDASPPALLKIAQARNDHAHPDLPFATWAIRTLERKAKKDEAALGALIQLAEGDDVYAMQALPLRVEAALQCLIAACKPDRTHWVTATKQLFDFVDLNKAPRENAAVAETFARAAQEPACPKEAFVGLSMTRHPKASELLAARANDADPVTRQWVDLALKTLSKSTR